MVHGLKYADCYYAVSEFSRLPLTGFLFNTLIVSRSNANQVPPMHW